MSKASGMAALHLQMTDCVPRTEYSAGTHWPLVEVVTGVDTSVVENREGATRAFMKAWDYAFNWHTHVNHKFYERNNGRYTKMGHAIYAELTDGSSDFNNNLAQPFKDPEDVYAFDPVEEYGMFDRSKLVAELEADYHRQEQLFGDTVCMGGVYVTLFSGLIDMFGWDMLLTSMAIDPPRFVKVVDRYAQWVMQFYEAYAESSVPVIMSHDDLCWTSGVVTSPSWYREHLFPHLKRLWEPILESGKRLIFTSDGNWTEFFDDIVACGAHAVVMEPCSDMALFAERYGHRVGFIGNADTRVLLQGGKEEIFAEVKRCMDIGKQYPGFILAVGNHIPQNTPVEHALWYEEAYRLYRIR
jgi:hypothetical protein